MPSMFSSCGIDIQPESTIRNGRVREWVKLPVGVKGPEAARIGTMGKDTAGTNVRNEVGISGWLSARKRTSAFPPDYSSDRAGRGTR